MVCIIRHGTRADPTHCSRLSARRSLSSRFRTLSFFLLPAAALFLHRHGCTSSNGWMRMTRSLRYIGGSVFSFHLGRLLALDVADWLPACRVQGGSGSA